MSLVEEPARQAGAGNSPVGEPPGAAGTGRERTGPPPLRRNRDFLLLWTAAAGTQVGARITAIAYPLLVLWYTGSATQAGFVGSAALLPHLLVQLRRARSSTVGTGGG